MNLKILLIMLCILNAPIASAYESDCELLAKLREAKASLNKNAERVLRQYIKPIKTIYPREDKLSQADEDMIHTTIAPWYPSKPLTKTEAITQFIEGGAAFESKIVYFKIMERSHTYVAQVVWFPGENEYGRVFKVHSIDHATNPELIGSIVDSFVECH